MAQIGHHGVAREKLERQLLELLAALHHVLGRVDMAPGMEPHVDAAHDLSRAARRVVLLQHLDRELHVLAEALGRVHAVLAAVELEADVDDLAEAQRHGRSPLRAV